MNETFLSWIEFELLLRRLEEQVQEPKRIEVKRDYIKEKETTYQASVRSHYRYKDFSILNGYCESQGDK